MDASLSSSRPRHQRKCVAIIEIIQFPHKHSKSSDIRILEQFKYRCQEKKTLKENSNIKNGVSGDAQVGNYWNPSGRSWSLITMTSEGENSGKFKRLRHGGEILWLVGTGTKHSHSFDFKATFKARINSNKRCFCVGERSANCIGPSRVG